MNYFADTSLVPKGAWWTVRDHRDTARVCRHSCSAGEVQWWWYRVMGWWWDVVVVLVHCDHRPGTHHCRHHCVHHCRHHCRHPLYTPQSAPLTQPDTETTDTAGHRNHWHSRTREPLTQPVQSLHHSRYSHYTTAGTVNSAKLRHFHQIQQNWDIFIKIQQNWDIFCKTVTPWHQQWHR